MDCGARRGALAPAIARWIGVETAAEQVAGDESPAVTPDSANPEHVSRRPAVLSPSIVGIAVMALLAFGVLLGSTVSSVQESSASGPLVLAVSHTPQAASRPAPAEAVSPPSATPQATPLPASSTSPPPSAATPAPKRKSTKPSNTKSTQPSGGLGTQALPPIKHVFLIVLSDTGFNQSFGPGAPATYLSKKLVSEGELLNDFYAVSGGELANEIALISGQGPTVQTAEDCPLYTAVTPATVGADGQVLGSGCVYPAQTDTLAEQLTADGLTWKAYIEGVDEGPAQPTCPHPALGAADGNHTPTAGDPDVTWRDPFVYFEGVTGNATCASSIVGLGQLAPSLKAAQNTPALSYIVPDRCHDGSEEPCAPGEPAGLAASDSFLSTVVPEIESSPAYKQGGGLIAITFDQAPQSGADADTGGCCMTSAFPNLPTSAASTTTTTAAAGATSTAAPATTTGTTEGAGTTPTGTTAPAGGGRVGLLLISKYTAPASINVTGEYNDFSLLASIEDLFGVSHLGYADSEGLLAFNKSVYNAHP